MFSEKLKKLPVGFSTNLATVLFSIIVAVLIGSMLSSMITTILAFIMLIIVILNARDHKYNKMLSHYFIFLTYTAIYASWFLNETEGLFPKPFWGIGCIILSLLSIAAYLEYKHSKWFFPWWNS
jgi:hypothetical protein